ncbi:hypothetical protein MTO96_017629 [Rhipicephalus appendiculatus]
MPYGQAPYGQTPYGQTPYTPEPNALAPYGQSPYEQPPYGERPYGQQNEGYDCVPVVEDDKTEMSGRSTWMTIAMCCTAALIVLGIVLGMLAFTCSTIERQPLVCIMGEYLYLAEQFPPDGMCDYIFMDSLYMDGHWNKLLDESSYYPSLTTFLHQHPGYRNTTLGLGFSFECLAKAEEDLKATNPSPLTPFWNRGIFHAGILDTPSEPTRDEMKAGIATLKVINRVLDTVRNRGETAITVMSFPNPNPVWASRFAENFRELRFTPTLLISNGFYRWKDAEHHACFIMPPTRHPDDIPPPEVLRVYSFDVSSPMYQLRSFYANGSDTRGILGVSLYARFSPPASKDHVDIYQPCNTTYFGIYAEVCPGGGGYLEGSVNYSAEHYVMYAFVSSGPHIFSVTYDNEEAFSQKLTAVKNLDPSVSFGLAVYGVEDDDYANKCAPLNKYGAFSRLKQLRKLLDSFNDNYGE